MLIVARNASKICRPETITPIDCVSCVVSVQRESMRRHRKRETRVALRVCDTFPPVRQNTRGSLNCRCAKPITSSSSSPLSSSSSSPSPLSLPSIVAVDRLPLQPGTAASHITTTTTTHTARSYGSFGRRHRRRLGQNRDSAHTKIAAPPKNMRRTLLPRRRLYFATLDSSILCSDNLRV